MANILGWIGAICFTAGGIPQAWKCFRQKNAHGLNISFLVLWLAGEVCLCSGTLIRFGWVDWKMFNYMSGTLCALVIFYYKMFPRRDNARKK